MIRLWNDTVENTEISSSDSRFVGFAGEIKLSTIQKNVKRMMREDFSLFSLGIGFDVDFDFLERIATENRGVAQRIFANKDAAEQLRVRRLFELLIITCSRISSAVPVPTCPPSCSAADVLQAGLCSPAEEDQHSVPRGRRVRRHSEPLRQVLQRLGAGGGREGAAVGEQQPDQLHQRLSRESIWFTRVCHMCSQHIFNLIWRRQVWC